MLFRSGLGDQAAARSVAAWRGRLDAFVDRGVERAVVTLGADGAVVLDATATDADAAATTGGSGGTNEVDDGRVTVVSAPAVEAVDTTGCGDAFTGAVAHQLAAGASLQEAVRFAVEVGALAATREGAQASYPVFAHL